MHIVLLSETHREGLAQDVEDLKTISVRAQTVLSELEDLTKEGRELAQSHMGFEE